MAESGTCNVCSAPCTSCMHFNRLLTGMKTEGSSSEAICDNTSSQQSANKKKQSFNCLQDTASATSSQESISENKETVGTYYKSENVTYSDLSAAGSPGRGQTPRSLASFSNVKVSNKFGQKYGEECPEARHPDGMYSTIVDKVNSSVNISKLQNSSMVNDSGAPRFVKSENIQSLPHKSGSCFGVDEARYMKSEKDKKNSNFSNLGGSSFLLVDTMLESVDFDFSESHKGSPVVRSSDASVKPKMKTGVKNEKDSKYLQEESFDVVSASRRASNDLTKLTEVKESLLESHSGDDSEEIVEHDVNICDICGDAGREDLLATCSGCSDGAEHTYCMQEKMEKVPEGEWFCEECRLAEKIRKQRETVDEAVKTQPLSRLRSLSRNLSVRLDSKELYDDGNRSELYKFGTQTRKRQLEKVESFTAPKRQAVEIAKDFAVASSPHRLSRDGSFKSVVREKVNKSPYQASYGIHNLSARRQTHKGPLSKSNSFNATVSSKLKDKSVDDMPHKQKVPFESTDARDGANRLMARSLSLRPVHVGRPSTGEPKVIMLSPKLSHASEMKGFKKSKDHLSYERKKSFRDERTPSMSSSLVSALDTDQKTGSCENSLVSLDHNSKDSKAAQPDGKVILPSKITGQATHSALDMPEKKLYKPHGNNDSASGTRTPPQDASYQAVKNTDSNLTRSRLGKLNNGSSLCQRCKEPITGAHVCAISSSRMSAAELSAAGISVDDADKANPIKAALHAAFLKKSVICKKRRSPDREQFDEQSVHLNTNGRHVSHDVGSNCTKNTSSAEKKHIQKSTESVHNNLIQSSMTPKEHMSGKEMMLGSVVSGDGKSNTKALPNHSMSTMFIAPTSTIPMHDYIWQGDFEVSRNGEKAADMHPGFQAHLSTFASPKVVEVAHKISPKLSLTEITRANAWPAQFYETGATEDNIALYFFAKDIESYERHYKILLDDMMRNDLALKGTVNGVEILIFTSSQLPLKSQRWNMLFFLWGVFRAKKHNCEKNQTVGLSRRLETPERSCLCAYDASPSIPMPAPQVPLTGSKQLECESGSHSVSGRTSRCAQSWPSADSFGEEHIVGMDCEIKSKPRLNGDASVRDSAAMLGNKCTMVLEGSMNDRQCTSCDRQELYSVSPKGICYFGKDNKEVDRAASEGKINNEDSDGKPNPKKQPSMKDPSAKAYDCEQSNQKKCFPLDLTEITCPDSDRGTSETLLAGLGSKDVTVPSSASDTLETGPNISSKKILYDLNLDAKDLLEEPGTAEGFLSVVESSQVMDFQGANSNGWDLNTSANEVQIDLDSKNNLDPGPPSFDLALSTDTESFSPRNGAQPLFGEVDNTFQQVAGRHEVSSSASLSLSLALPRMDEKKQSSKEATASGEQLTTKVNAQFLLFGRLADK